MKKPILLILLFSLSFSFSQEKKDPFSKFSTEKMETSYLLLTSPLVNIQAYNNNKNNMYDFYQVYKDIMQSNLKNRNASLDALKSKTQASKNNNIIPLAILHNQYETIKQSAFQNGKVIKDASGFVVRTSTDAIFNKHQVTIAAPLRIKTKGLKTNFKLDSEAVINTTDNIITGIKVDFNDDLGWRTIEENQNIAVQYSDAGTKEINFELTFEDASVITTRAVLNVTYSNSDLNNMFNRQVTTFTGTTVPNLAPYGEASTVGVGEYEIFMSTESGAVLDKPIYIIDGFDPDDGRPIVGYTDSGTGDYVPGIYDLMDFNDGTGTENLADLVREEGFDVIVVNFPGSGGADYIERNAMLLVDLITAINNDPNYNVTENVIIGPSMGGLISRFALNYMENQSLDHKTRLWLSFDSPHHGANVPIGFQHQFNFLAYGLDDFTLIGNMNVVEIQPIIDGMLKSPAARQMLTDQFEPHLDPNASRPDVDFDSSKNLPQKHPHNPTFYGIMNALTATGFPEDLRKISMINGSGINSRYKDKANNDIFPGHLIVDADFEVDATSSADLIATVNFTPNNNVEANVSDVHLDFPFWFILANDRYADASSKANPNSNGIDAASGGLFDIGGLTAGLGTTGVAGEYLTALKTDFFNFIPSVSAMAFHITNNEIDWFHTPTGITTARATTNTTPFDAWYMPDDNEPHVTLTPQNVQFAWDEIVLNTLTTTSLDEHFIKLEKNPVKDNLTILSSTTFENTKISIIDITGKIVYNNTMTLNNRTSIPMHFASGLYILNVETIDNQNFKTKFVVH
ncbi:MAG: T9SS type A sorting domain-containing protein [Oceanihabitans sp.]